MEQNGFFNLHNDQYNPQVQGSAQLDHIVPEPLIVPELLNVPESLNIPGPLIISDSAIAIWNSTTQTAQDRIQNHRSALQREPITMTDEDKCWLTLMALRREQELEETMRYVDNSWRELNEIRRLLGIRRN